MSFWSGTALILHTGNIPLKEQLGINKADCEFFVDASET